ncbi:hypothetical protein EC968_007928, partial [Mortierella alpina]
YITLSDLEQDNEDDVPQKDGETSDDIDSVRGDDASMDSVHTDQTRQEILERIRLPKATRVTAKNLQDISFTNAYSKARNKVIEQVTRSRMKEPPDPEGNGDHDLEEEDGKLLSRALESVSAPENSLLCARSMQDVFRISAVRREAREPLRQFKKHPRLLRLKQTQRLRKKRAKKRVAARLKRCIKEHALASHSGEEPPEIVTAIAYGAAGSCVGGRIGGHLKWGGDWLKKHLLWMDMLVSVTDEYCTSQICPYCYSRVQLSTSRRVVGTAIKTRKLHGSIECRNRACVSYKCGYGTRPRDTNAATNILISGASIWVSGGPWPITPFSRYIRPKNVPTTTTSRSPLDNNNRLEHSYPGVQSRPLRRADMDQVSVVSQQ